MKNTIYPLFAYPVVICKPPYEFSDAEKAYIDGLEMTKNIGNTMSEDDHVLDSEELADLRKYIDEQIHIYKQSLLRIKDENKHIRLRVVDGPVQAGHVMGDVRVLELLEDGNKDLETRIRRIRLASMLRRNVWIDTRMERAA